MATQGNRAAQAQSLLEHYSRLKKALIWGLVAAVIMLVVGIMVLLSKPEPQGPSAVPATAPVPKRVKWIRLATFEAPADKYSQYYDIPLSPNGRLGWEVDGDTEVDVVCKNDTHLVIRPHENVSNRDKMVAGQCRFMGVGKASQVRLYYPEVQG
jgi:hypothetical protein